MSKLPSEIEILLTQYDIVQKHQQDSNTRLSQLWIGFGALITAAGILIITKEQVLILLAPFGFIGWFFLLGMMSYDNHYRAIFLAFLETEINLRVGTKTPLMLYESFASATNWKIRFKGRWGIPLSIIWLILNFTTCTIIYVVVCIFALMTLPDRQLRIYLALIYFMPMVVYLLITFVSVPRQMRRFAKDLQAHNFSDTETIHS